VTSQLPSGSRVLRFCPAMSGPPPAQDVRIFVDEAARTVAAGTTVVDAVAANDVDLAASLRSGRAYLTDGVGRPIELAAVVFPGAIYRVVRAARREVG
jgi:hypothetical protein